MSEQTQGKGRPTPKRSQAEKRRGGPVPPPPTTRKEAAKQLRAKQAVNRDRIKTGTLAGDEANLMPRDSGPVRRLVRNTIDGRRGLGWLLLPVAGVLVLAQLSRDPAVLAIAVGLWLATLIGVAFDLVLTAVLLRKTILEAYPQEQKLRGHIGYGLLRSTVIRRFRMPRPVVSRGRLKA